MSFFKRVPGPIITCMAIHCSIAVRLLHSVLQELEKVKNWKYPYHLKVRNKDMKVEISKLYLKIDIRGM